MTFFSKWLPWRYWLAKRELQQEKDEALARYQRIFRGAYDYGYFDWRLQTDDIVWSGGYWNHLGYSSSDLHHISTTEHYMTVHPDDVDTSTMPCAGLFRQWPGESLPVQKTWRLGMD